MAMNRPKESRGNIWSLQEIAEYLGMKKMTVYRKVLLCKNAPKPIHYENKVGYYDFDESIDFIKHGNARTD